jgi:hypothetical protein
MKTHLGKDYFLKNNHAFSMKTKINSERARR